MLTIARFHAQRILAFGLTSIIGLTIDIVTFAGLLNSGFDPAAASRLSSAAAVTFVYYASVRRTFHYDGGFIVGLFALYAGYQVLAIYLAAEVVAGLVTMGIAPLSAKTLILPLTFPANYLAMSIITSRRAERYS